MTEHRRPGLAAAVTKDGQVIWHESFGVADLESGAPVTPATSFSVCSLSKPVLLVAVLQTIQDLAQSGQVTRESLLDADLGALIAPSRLERLRHPDFADTPISLRMLLAHVSGIRDDYTLVAHHSAVAPPLFRYEGPALDEALNNYLNHADEPRRAFTPNEPGTKSRYTSVGSAIAALLVVRKSGQSFEDFTQQHIFDPLGMKDSAWRLHDVVRKSPEVVIARGYHWTTDTQGGARNVAVEPAFADHTFFPAASLRTTILDYATFLAALAGTPQGSRLLDADAMREALRIQYPAVDPLRSLILTRMRRGGVEVVGHDGNNDGFRSTMFFTPQPTAPGGSIYGVVILTNGDATVDGATLEARLGSRLLSRALANQLIEEHETPSKPQPTP